MRYEYMFERVGLAIELPLRLRPASDYHRIIEARAREGWRLVQVFAPSVFVLGGGIPDWFELIFERPVDQQSVASAAA
jgi:hypothetical protein